MADILIIQKVHCCLQIFTCKQIDFNFCLTFVSGIHKLKMSLPARNPKSVRAQPFDPIPPVAEKISSQWSLLCFDEFQVMCSDQISTMSGHTQKHIILSICIIALMKRRINTNKVHY